MFTICFRQINRCLREHLSSINELQSKPLDVSWNWPHQSVLKNARKKRFFPLHIPTSVYVHRKSAHTELPTNLRLAANFLYQHVNNSNRENSARGCHHFARYKLCHNGDGAQKVAQTRVSKTPPKITHTWRWELSNTVWNRKRVEKNCLRDVVVFLFSFFCCLLEFSSWNVVIVLNRFLLSRSLSSLLRVGESHGTILLARRHVGEKKLRSFDSSRCLGNPLVWVYVII